MNRNSSQDQTMVSRSNKKSKLPLLLGCFFVLALLFGVVILGGFFYSTTSASEQSVVFIRAPQQGEVLIANQPFQVSALARDDHKITRIELWIDGVLIDAQTSNTQGGINPFPLLTTWYPPEGTHTLIVRAFNSRNQSTQASITVNATALADRDFDGIADDADACPDEAGSEAAEGCPDRDFDGVTDATDACPDEAGLPPDGCPTPSESDRDGDGMLDSADACPDEVGSPLADGCPDADGDGVADGTDACPAEPGASADGCPEPEGALPPDPAPDGGDEPPLPRPGDEPPVPEDDDEPEPGGIGEVFPLPEAKAEVQLRIEAYYLALRNPYDRVWCYVRLDEGEPSLYEFDSFDDLHWDIAAELGGENSVLYWHEETQPLEISVECLGSNAGGRPVELEALAASHPREEWDGSDLRVESADALVHYRITESSCSESHCLAPILNSISLGPRGEGPYTLQWRWHGDESQIDGFALQISTEEEGVVDTVYLEDSAMRSLDMADYMPACGETFYFEMYAYAEGIHSSMSNPQYWPGDTCTYTASVTFTTVEVHNPPADEDGLHRPGPIYGNFWISNGTTVENLDFNACWCYFGPGMTFWGWCEGLELPSGTYSINRGIFDWIDRAQASCIGNGCNSNDFYAPFSSSLHIPLENDSDLTIGGLIMDCDARNSNDVVFEEQGSIRINTDDLDYLTIPIPFELDGDHINLNSFIRMGR